MRQLLCVPALLVLAACATPPPPPPAPETPKAQAPLEDISLGEAPPDGQLPRDVRPQNYSLRLQLDPSLPAFSGEAEIALTLDKARSLIWLHGRGLVIAKVSVEDSAHEAVAATWTQVDDTGLAKLQLARAIAPGKALLHIWWSAPFDPQLTGIYKTHAGSNDFVFSKFEATYARRAFPCFDEPGFKTPFAISLEVPENDAAYSNAPERASAPGAAGKKLVTFAETPPLPTYLVAFIAGKFEISQTVLPPNPVRKDPLPLRVLAVLGTDVKHLQLALREGQGSIEELEKKYGLPFPYPKIDLIAVPDFQSGAMENAGAITFRDELLLVDETSASLEQRSRVASVIAHELSHQWFGDLVTMRWWDDLWLNEGFATFMATRVLEARHPELQAELDEVQASGGVMSQDELISARKIRQPIASTHDITNAFDGITYEKGAAVLGMFEHWLGEEKFFAGIRAYLRAHENGNASTADLLAALSDAAGFDVRGPFESFLDRSGVPLIEASVSCADGKGSLVLKQSRSLPLGSTGSRDEIWQVPVCLRYGEGASVRTRCDLISAREQTISLDSCPNWLLPDADAAGYYRWSLSPNDLRALQKNALPKLATGERITYAQNLVSAFRSGALPAGEVLAALLPLASDPSGAVAEQPIGILSFIHDEIALPAKDNKPLAAVDALASKLYTPLLEGKKGLGWRSAPGESSDRRKLREALISFLALDMDDAKVRQHAARLGLAYLGAEKIDPSQVDPDLVSLVLTAAAVDGDAKLFEKLSARLFASDDSLLRQRLLAALSAVRDPKLAAAARDLSFDPRLRQNERLFPYYRQLQDVHNRDAAWTSLQEKFDALAKLLPDRYAGFLVRALDFCDAAHEESVKSFFASRIDGINGGPRNLASALEQMQLCAARVTAQGASVHAFLKR